ncbi:MAG: branched-chain amino acid ABC transporter permease, partial [Chloroflexi bacterium]|nr:branched-chain amino acid ABC transporter permease [Chloroflexota bacterium]
MSSEEFVQYLVFGIQDGSIYALIGLGFTIIYAVTNIINFAQGEFVMLGGMLSYMLVEATKAPTLPTVVIALMVAVSLGLFLYSLRARRIRRTYAILSTIFTLGSIPFVLFLFKEFASMEIDIAPASILPILMAGAIGAIVYLLAIRSAKRPSTVSLIIITIGAAIFLRGIAGELWGVAGHRTPVYWERPSLEFMGAMVHTQTIFIFGSMVAVTILLQLFFSYTMLGKSLKACAINPVGAGLMGINPKMMALIAFALAAALGAVVGTVMTPKTGMDYERGFV